MRLQMCGRFARWFAASWLLLSVAAAQAVGQASTGAIVGTVRDSSGAVLPGVTITIRNEGTNATRDVVTGESGDYSAPLLPPGNYELTADLTGFGRRVAKSIKLEVNQTVRMDFALT